MNGITKVFGDIRGAAPIALALVVVLAVQVNALLEARERTRGAERRADEVRIETSSLEVRLADEQAERERLGLEQAGPGPGGITTPWDDRLFRGPTAARSALELALAADAVGYRKLRYEDQGVRVLSRFPGGGDEGDMGMDDGVPSPVRDRYSLVEWPVLLSVESDYDSLVALLEQLAFSRPSFAVKNWQIKVLRDERGRLLDRLGFEGTLSTFWLTKES